jgi:energy-coupling factor transporter ATP-binding protein EcfA2
MISVKGLSFSFFNSDRKALDDVSLEIPAGQFIVITGPSGCGKSTLALAIGGYIPHVFEGRMQGTVAIDGMLTADAELSELASHVGIVQQDPESQLCTLNVEDEVSFGPENLLLPESEVEGRVAASLAEVGGAYLRDRQVYELSGGEKQRVAIASMLAMGPGALILDEPTSSLDPPCASEVFEAIGRLRGTGMTIVVIEHKLDRLLKLADRLVVMDSGRIVLDGKPFDVVGQYRDRIKAMGVRLPGLRCPAHATDGGRAMLRPIVEARGLRASYDGTEVLHAIDFSAYPSEIVGIMGPNGSGKTTLLGTLLGLHRPDSGTVAVAGMDAARAKTSALARKAGFVFQNPNHQIFERTVLREASFACRNFGLEESRANELAMAALGRYGLAGYADKHPLGLSFGEKRRLNLCSILPHGPSLLLLDEPFIGQDYANVERMCAELHKLKEEGKAIVLVSHDVDMVYRHCDRIVLLKEGRVLVDAPAAEAQRMLVDAGMPDYVPEDLDEN